MTVLRVKAFDHLVLNVADVERSRAFYTGPLGLEPVRVDEWRAGKAPFPSVRVTRETIIDLVAGPLVDSADSVLPKIDRIHPLNASEVTKWRGAFSRDGKQFAYSTGRSDTDRENLWVIETASMVSSFVFSPWMSSS